MIRPRRSIGRATRAATRDRRLRENETEELHEARIAQERERLERSRSNLRPTRICLNLLAFAYDCNVDYGAHKAVDIGEMNKKCRYCKALKFKGETPGLCCMSGKVRLPESPSSPEPLFTLLKGETPESKHFLSKIRNYNCRD